MSNVLVTVDVGNTTTRLCLYEEPGQRDRPKPDRTADLSAEELAAECVALNDFVAGRANPVRWSIASVNRAARLHLTDWLAVSRPNDEVRVLRNDDIPIVVDVKFPARVGIDRLLAAAAVNRLREPTRPAIVVDAGSAVTVDLVSADAVFRGGAILPGFAMACRALAADTDGLPLVRDADGNYLPEAVGKSTDEAIRSGVVLGTIGAVRELTQRINSSAGGNCQIFVTGGGMPLLESVEDYGGQFVADLVSTGIVLTERRHSLT